MYKADGAALTFLSPLSYSISSLFVRIIYMQDEHVIYHPFFLVKLALLIIIPGQQLVRVNGHPISTEMILSETLRE